MINRILNPTKAQRVHVGYVWYDQIKHRPCYGPVRKVLRGKKKGSFEVWIMGISDDYGLHLRKRIFSADSIVWLKEGKENEIKN